MKVTRAPGVFVFASVATGVHAADSLGSGLNGLHPVVTVTETEGTTLVVPSSEARRAGLDHDPLELAWLTVDTATALDAVGITAAFSRVLAEAGIACNVVAGRFHDHLFVPADRADETVALLTRLP